MTDGTPAPLTPPPGVRRTYRLPAAVADAVTAWATVRGISENAAFCLLIRTGLANAIRDPNFLPARLQLAGNDAFPVKKSITLPERTYMVLTSWAELQPHIPGRDVATAILCVAALSHSLRTEVPLPLVWPPGKASCTDSPDTTLTERTTPDEPHDHQ